MEVRVEDLWALDWDDTGVIKAGEPLRLHVQAGRLACDEKVNEEICGEDVGGDFEISGAEIPVRASVGSEAGVRGAASKAPVRAAAGATVGVQEATSQVPAKAAKPGNPDLGKAAKKEAPPPQTVAKPHPERHTREGMPYAAAAAAKLRAAGSGGAGLRHSGISQQELGGIFEEFQGHAVMAMALSQCRSSGGPV
jgi:hypothetical protein